MSLTPFPWLDEETAQFKAEESQLSKCDSASRTDNQWLSAR
ncbi:hypothetical protein ACPV3O_02410 [Vibrio rotiferianus]|nr:hypothetical protein [Vibrio rotiferianus]